MQDKKNTLPKNSNIKIRESNEPSPMFPYQDEAIKNLEKLDKAYDTYRTLVVVPTGGGKTRIAVQYLYRDVLNRQGTKHSYRNHGFQYHLFHAVLSASVIMSAD